MKKNVAKEVVTKTCSCAKKGQICKLGKIILLSDLVITTGLVIYSIFSTIKQKKDTKLIKETNNIAELAFMAATSGKKGKNDAIQERIDKNI